MQNVVKTVFISFILVLGISIAIAQQQPVEKKRQRIQMGLFRNLLEGFRCMQAQGLV